MRKCIKVLLVGIAALLVMPGLVGAYSLSDIQTWIGSGEKEVGFILDFNDGSDTDSFVWGYRYNGDIPVETTRKINWMNEAIQAVVDGTDGLDADYQVINQTMKFWLGFSYGDHAWTQSSWYSAGPLWVTLTSAAQELTGEDQWKKAPFNGDISWIAVAWGANKSSATVSVPKVVDIGPDTPAPTPEPGTIFLLGLGMTGLATFCRARVRR